jgi:4-hydroxy-tetrahydrodipicolinate reductase
VIRVCVAGATGWVGSALVPAIEAAPDLALVAAVSRTAAGKRLDEVLPPPAPPLRVSGTLAEALAAPCDVLVDFTSASAVRAHVLAGIAAGARVVVGSSGLGDEDFPAIDAAARARGVGVLAVGNFALTAVLLERLAAEAARHVGSWEIVDYGVPRKPDAPSGTARQLAARLAAVRAPTLGHPLGETVGAREARGATVAGTQVHSLRLPGFVSSIEIVFGLPDERLTIRHDSGSGAAPYVAGTLLAVRKVGGIVGLVRGLDALLDS